MGESVPRLSLPTVVSLGRECSFFPRLFTTALSASMARAFAPVFQGRTVIAAVARLTVSFLFSFVRLLLPVLAYANELARSFVHSFLPLRHRVHFSCVLFRWPRSVPAATMQEWRDAEPISKSPLAFAKSTLNSGPVFLASTLTSFPG